MNARERYIETLTFGAPDPELERIAPVVRDGGFIPSCDHGIPSDVSWKNFVDYCRQLAEMTGWL
jgi:hypothetical protein